MKQTKRGISLIVLVITIIVMIVLAATIIISLNNTNIINKAQEAVDKTSEAELETETRVKELQASLAPKWSGEKADKFLNGTVASSENIGTKDNPYVIENGEQLEYFASLVNAGNTFEGKYIVITKSINLNNKPFTPIGLGTTGSRGENSWIVNSHPFKGTLDGQNNVITGLNIQYPLVHGVGLIGVLENGGMVKNINLYEGNIVGKTCVAGIVGASRGKVYNCKNSTNVTAQDNNDDNSGQMAGGIVGFIGGGSIDKCINSGYVFVKTDSGFTCRGKYSGGITGYAYGIGIKITNCTNNGKVECMHQQVGGIIGATEYNTNEVIISNCTNNGNITARYTTTIGHSGILAGGIIGWDYGPANIDGCVNNGVVTSVNYWAGGIAALQSDGIITNCINNGMIITEKKNTVGGIVGKQENGGIISCLNNGEVISKLNCAGGIVGYQYLGTISECHNTGNITAHTNQSGGITGGQNMGSVNNVSNFGKILCRSQENYGAVGGISGALGVGTISNAYNYGEVETMDNELKLDIVGGIVGLLWKEGSITNSYNRGNITGGEMVGGIVGDKLKAATVNKTYYYTNVNSIKGVGSEEETLDTIKPVLQPVEDVTGKTEKTVTNITKYSDFIKWIANK